VSRAAPKEYQQRNPENSVLYRIIQQHLESFIQHAHESSGQRLPKYVENEFRRYLECGLHAHGFARLVCETCGDELLLPFSCKLRGICPSCNTRRMSNTAAHLVDHIIAPDVTLRQWVLTVPFELRLLVAAKPDALSAIGRIFIQEIQRWQRQRARALGVEQAEGAAVSFCQRFGSSLNLNVHWHVIVPDALFMPDATGDHVDTLKHRAPTRLDLEEIVTAIATRSVGWLDKHGYLRREGGEDPAENANTDSPWMRCLQSSLGVGELQRWAQHGRAQENANPVRGRSLPKPTTGLGAQHLKFNLHAGVSAPGGLPAARERLIRYCARPPLALERLSVLEDGRICYRIKDSEQVRVMTPTQFMARAAALVPPPRHPLVRFYGVWAPHHRWRTRIVIATPKTKRSSCSDPSGPSAATSGTDGSAIAAGETRPSPPSPDGIATKPETQHMRSEGETPPAAAIPRTDAAPCAPSHDASAELRFTSLSRLDWATLYQRVFDIDPLECSSCGGRMRFVEVIEDFGRARSELRRRNLPAQPPPLARARSPDWAD
jgi:hypothetical protein